MIARISDKAFNGLSKAKGRPSSRVGYSTYIPKRADANQGQIVGALRRLGFTVDSIHEVGRGVFDLSISKRGLNIWVEVKDGRKPPSARELTKAQKRWNFSHQGMRCVVTCYEDCVSLARQVNDMLVAIEAAGIVLSVVGSRNEQYLPGFY